MKQVLHNLRKSPWSARFGILVVAFYVFVALFGPLLTPYGESEIVGFEYEPWGAEFLLGTDNLGRDMLTRLIYGARNTIGIAFFTTVLAFLVGCVAGFLAATVGGWTEQAISRVNDILMAIPQLIFALMILTIAGTSVPVLIVVIALLDSTRVYRLARAVAMNIVVMDFVEVARLRGEGLWWIMRSEVLPNALPPLVAEFGLRFCFVFLLLSAAQLPRARHPAAHGRLGQHGARQCDADHVRRLHAHPAGGLHRTADHRREFHRRLAPSTNRRGSRMPSKETTAGPREPLLTMTGLRIEGQADEEWHEIVHGVDVVLRRGEVLGLIGESGAGKSTIGLAAMGFAQDRLARSRVARILFDGTDLREQRRGSEVRQIRGGSRASPTSHRVRLPPSIRRKRLNDQVTESGRCATTIN